MDCTYSGLAPYPLYKLLHVLRSCPVHSLRGTVQGWGRVSTSERTPFFCGEGYFHPVKFLPSSAHHLHCCSYQQRSSGGRRSCAVTASRLYVIARRFHAICDVHRLSTRTSTVLGVCAFGEMMILCCWRRSRGRRRWEQREMYGTGVKMTEAHQLKLTVFFFIAVHSDSRLPSI